jgi:hypothetical protein
MWEFTVLGENGQMKITVLLCELEGGFVRAFDFATLVRKRGPFFNF